MTQTKPQPSSTADPNADNPHHERRWLILAVLALAQLMVILDTTVVNIALPAAQRALHFSNDDRQWIITAYSLAFGSLLLLGGRLSDLLGRKNVLLIGVAGFAVASAVGGAANGFAMLVIARAVQGAFGALLAPAALSVLTTSFTEPKERAKAFGIFGAVSGGGIAIGLLLGGVLTEYLSWRYCMYVNLIFAVAVFAGGLALLRNVRDAGGARLDVPGTVTVSAGFFCLVYGFSHASSTSWSDAWTIGFLAASAVLLAVFAVIESRVASPLLPLKVLASRNRVGAYASVFLSGMGLFGVFLFLTYYLQAQLGYSAVRTGVSFLPMVGMIVVVSIVGQTVLATRIGPKWTVGTGMLLSGLALVLLTRIGVSTPWATHVLPATVVLGAGLGFIFASVLSLATSGVDPEHTGVASALVNVGQQVGGSVGLALLSTIETSAVTAYLLAHHSASKLAVAHAAVHGYITAFWWSAGIFAVGVVVAGALLSARAPEHADSTVPGQ